MTEKGQILMELLVAMGIFVLVACGIVWLILDSYSAQRASRERIMATFLAREGMEAARSIRDNGWSGLENGSHGLSLSGNSWIFQGNQDDISNRLNSGVRKVIVEEIDQDRKKITSQVVWKISDVRLAEVILMSFLTNWAKTAP